LTSDDDQVGLSLGDYCGGLSCLVYARGLISGVVRVFRECLLGVDVVDNDKDVAILRVFPHRSSSWVRGTVLGAIYQSGSRLLGPAVEIVFELLLGSVMLRSENNADAGVILSRLPMFKERFWFIE
jgi:hypothetical protein